MKILNNFIRRLRYSWYIKYLNFINNTKKSNFNFSNRNKLTLLFNKYGSDKGNLNNMHNYSNFYESLFYKLKNKQLNLMEVGLGSVDENVYFHMKFMSKNYGRISVLTSYRLKLINKFFVSNNCFVPAPKIISNVLHLKPIIKKKEKIKNIENLEKVTNILFSNQRKMINKNLKKILNENQIKTLNLNLKKRPSDLKPQTYFKITELFELS